MATRLYLHNESLGDPGSFLVSSSATGPARAAAVDNFGNIYVVGGSGFGSLVQKYTPTGSLTWQRSLGGTGSLLYGFYIQVGPTSGNVYISTLNGSTTPYWASFSSDGSLRWQTTGASPKAGSFMPIYVDSSENMYSAEWISSAGAGYVRCWRVNTSNGSVISSPSGYGNVGLTGGISGITVDAAGNFWVTGSFLHIGQGNTDQWFGKYNSTGAWQLGAVLGTTGADFATGIVSDSSSNVYIVGTINQSPTVRRIAISKWNSSGVNQWFRGYGTNAINSGNGIAIDSSSNVYVVGSSVSGGITGGVIAKYDTNGNFLWQRGITSSQPIEATGIAYSEAGFIVVTLFNQVTQAFEFMRLLNDGSDVGKYGDYFYTFGAGTSNSPSGGSQPDTNNNQIVGAATGSASSFATATTNYSLTKSSYTYTTNISYQPPQTLTQWASWVSSTDNSTIDFLKITVDVYGNPVIAGRWTLSTDTDMFICKFNNQGVIIWADRLGRTTGQEGWFAITSDESGNTYVVGNSDSTGGAGGLDIYLTKYNSLGNAVWQRSIGTSRTDQGFAVHVDRAENVYGGGYALHTSTPDYTFLVVKYDKNGNLLWQRGITGSSSAGAVCYGVTVDSDYNVYASGYAEWTGGGGLIAKWDSSGTFQWQRVLSIFGSQVLSLSSLGIDSSNNLYFSFYYNDIAGLAKYNSSGTIQWQKTFDTNASSNALQMTDIAVDSSDNIYQLGYYLNAITFSYEAIVIKWDSSGNVLWQKGISGSSQNYRGISLDYNGDPYISASSGASPYLVIKLNSSGTNGVFVGAGGTPNFQIYDSSFSISTSSLTDSAGTFTTYTPTFTANTRALIETAVTQNYETGWLNYPLASRSNNIATISSIDSKQSMTPASGPASGVTQSSKSFTSAAVGTTQKILLGTFISPTLNVAQTVGGGNITLNASENESNLNMNYWVNSLNIYVWRPSTASVVGTVRDSTASLGGLEPTAASSQQVTNITGITSSAVSAAAGDVIVCEIWGIFTQGMSTAYTGIWYYDGTTVNTTENAVVTNHASFVELTENLTFGTPTASNVRSYGFIIGG